MSEAEAAFGGMAIEWVDGDPVDDDGDAGAPIPAGARALLHVMALSEVVESGGDVTEDDWADCLADADAAIAEGSDPAMAYWIRSLTYRMRDEEDAELADLTRATELEPDREMFHHARAEALVRAGRFAQALEAYDAAWAARDPEDADADAWTYGTWRAYALARLGRLDEALASADAGIDALDDECGDDERIFALRSRAEVLELMGRFDEAVAVHDGMVEAYPDSGRARYDRAIVEEHAGRLADALADLRAAIALDPDLAEEAVRDDDFPKLAASPELGPGYRVAVGQDRPS